jgi:PAS domain S-box-containing protein
MLRQLVLIRRDGESRPVSLHAAPIPGDEHQPGGTVISCRDESHQRALQRERSRLLSDLSERVKELHCLVALGEVVEQEGLALTELLGKAIALLPEAMQHAEMAGADMSYQDWSCSTRVCPAGADVLEAELIVRDTPMGTLRVFYDQPCPPADEGPFLENERMLINAFAERLGRVIERLEYQRELTEVRAAVDSANDAALLLDSRHRPRYMNRAFRTMFECWEYTHCNAPACMFERPEDREDLLTACRQNLSWQREMPLKTCTGRTFQGHLRVTSIRDRGQSIGTLVMATDLTERHRMEAQLRHSQKLSAVGQLASGIAHEINTPTQFVGDNLRFLQEHLSGVLARLEQMQQCLGQADESTRDADIQLLRRALDEMDLAFLTREVPDALSQSVEGMDRIASIVGAMKDFSHNPSPGQFSQVDVGRMIRSTVTLARNEWKYCAEVHLDLPDDLPPVNCMADEISQVILNLLSNAAQALREVKDTKGSSGRIDISARQADEEMVIQVTDNGPGICDDVRERIFEPFFTTKEVGKGTGQGLAIAHATVVEGHQGSIAVDSQPGEGSTFTVRLPFDPTGFASQAKESVDGP